MSSVQNSKNPIGISPIILSKILDEQGNGLGFGDTKNFEMFRHEYAHPYLLDEIRIGPIDTNTLWRIEHGGLPLVGDWTSPFAMCRRLAAWETGTDALPTAQLGGSRDGIGNLAMLQFKLTHPLLILPNEQITVRLTRQGSPAVYNAANGPIQYINPTCVLQGRSLLSNFVPPPTKVVPYVMSSIERIPFVTALTPQLSDTLSNDSDLNNSTGQDLKLDRFGVFTSLDYAYGDGGISAGAPPMGGQPFELPANVQISESEGGYILKDLVDLHLLGNSTSRIWDVKGSLRAHQFWSLRTIINLAPYANSGVQPAEGPFIYYLEGAQFSLHAALVGYREVPIMDLMQESRDFAARRLP